MPLAVVRGYPARMNVNGLTDEQRCRLKANLVRQRDGLDGLIKRMQAVGWFTDDPMFQTILAAGRARMRQPIPSRLQSSRLPINSIDQHVQAEGNRAGPLCHSSLAWVDDCDRRL